jgi:hypothetical protein
MKKISPHQAILRFHLQVGIRLALRIIAASIAALFALYYILRPEFFMLLSRIIFLDKGWIMSGIISAAVCIFFARIAAGKVCSGLNGWIRHLPASQLSHRRMSLFAILVALLPILFILAFFSFFAFSASGKNPIAYFTGLFFVGISSAFCFIPIKRKTHIRALMVPASFLAGTGDWILLLLSIVLIITADRTAGSLFPARHPKRFRLSFRGIFFVSTLTWRSLRIRLMIPFIPVVLVLGLTYLFLVNNNFPLEISSTIVRLGAAAALVIFSSIFANLISIQRPPWPWSRSLPWSARQRILLDSFFLLSLAIPIFVLMGIWDFQSSLVLAAGFPSLALFSSGAIRLSSKDRLGPAGKILPLGLMGAFSLGLFPLMAPALLLLAPLLLISASNQDKKQEVSVLIQQRHTSEGDSLSWSE